MQDLLEYLLYFLIFLMVSGGIAVSFIQAQKFFHPQSAKKNPPAPEKTTTASKHPEEFIIFLLALIGFLLPILWGPWSFANFDFSIVIHGAQRIYHGQIPQCDFIVPTGPLVLYIQAFFYCIFGESLFAFLIHVACLNAFVTLLVFFLVRHKGSLEFAVCAALVASIWFYGIHPFPWFDATAYIMVIFTWLLWEKKLFPYQITPQIKPAIAVGIACGFAFLGKMNIGGVTFLLLTGLIFQRFWPKPWKPFLGLSLGALSIVGSYIFFLWFMGSTLIGDNLFFRPLLMERFSYLFVAERWKFFFTELPEVLFLVLFLFILSVGWERRRVISWKHTLDLLAFLGIAVFGKLTSRALRTLPFCLWGVILGLWGSRFFKHRSKLDQYAICFVLLLFGAYGVYWAFQPRFLYDPTSSSYAFTSPALKPYHIDVNTGMMIDEIVQTLQPMLDSEDSVLCLPNGGAINLALGRVSSFQFLWYDPGVTYFGEMGDEDLFLQSLIKNPPKWIVLTLVGQFVFLEDFRMMSLGIPQLKPHLDQHYHEVLKRPTFILLRHKS